MTTQYTLAFEVGEGGTGSMDPVGVNRDDTFTFPACVLIAPENKIFDHWEMSGVDGIFYPGGEGFADVKDGDWYTKAVAWAAG